MSDDNEENNVLYDFSQVMAGTADEVTRDRVRRQWEDPTSGLRHWFARRRNAPGDLLGASLEAKARRECWECNDRLETTEVLATRQDVVAWLTGKELLEEVRRKIRAEVNSPGSDICQVLEKSRYDHGTAFYGSVRSLLEQLINRRPRTISECWEYNEDWFEGTRFAQK